MIKKVDVVPRGKFLTQCNRFNKCCAENENIKKIKPETQKVRKTKQKSQKLKFNETKLGWDKPFCVLIHRVGWIGN